MQRLNNSAILQHCCAPVYTRDRHSPPSTLQGSLRVSDHHAPTPNPGSRLWPPHQHCPSARRGCRPKTRIFFSIKVMTKKITQVFFCLFL